MFTIKILEAQTLEQAIRERDEARAAIHSAQADIVRVLGERDEARAEVEALKQRLRVSEEQMDAIGDANALAVEVERLKRAHEEQLDEVFRAQLVRNAGKFTDLIPTGFVRTPSGVMHAVNHQALVQQARIAGARGILKLLFPAEPVENPFAGISAEEAASFTARSKP